MRQLVPALVSRPLQTRLQSSAAGDPAEFLYTKPGLRAKIIDGKKIAAAVKAEVADEVRFIADIEGGDLVQAVRGAVVLVVSFVRI